ncbi:MAG: TrkA family potassium uptake protein [Anaerolineaceae bacterium]
MKAIVIGCDRLGSELAYRLSLHGHEVVVVDQHRTSFVNLNPDFVGRTHEGDPMSQDVLLRAGIEETDALIALTETEATNYIVGYAAKEIFKVPHVIVRSFDPTHKMVCELMGLQAISSAIWGAEQLEEMLTHKDLKPVFTIAGGEVEIYTISIPPAWENHTLEELISDHNGQRAVSLTRSGDSFIPTGAQVLKEDDLLYVAANHEGIEALRQKISGKSEEAA